MNAMKQNPIAGSSCAAAGSLQRMRALLASTIVMSVCLVALGCGAAQSARRERPQNRGWVLVQPEGDGFVIEMPSEPTITATTEESSFGSLDQTVYQTTTDDGKLELYLVRTVYPKGTFSDTYTPDRALSDLRGEFVDSRDGGPIERNWFIQVQGAEKATMFIFRTKDERFWRVRQAIRGDIVYQYYYATTEIPLRKKGSVYLRSFALF